MSCYMYEKVIDILKKKVFGDKEFDCGDFFGVDLDTKGQDNCFIYVTLREVLEWNLKIFGRFEGKYLKRGKKTYNKDYDDGFINKWVDSFLGDIGVFIEEEDVCKYLRRLYNKRSEIYHVGFEIDLLVDSDDEMANLSVDIVLDGEIGKEKLIMNRRDGIPYRLINFNWMDDYEIETDYDGIVSESTIKEITNKIESTSKEVKVAKLFLQEGDEGIEKLGRNCCQVVDLGNEIYRVEFNYWELFHGEEDKELKWIEAICGKPNEYGSLIVEGTYEELDNMVKLVKKG